MFIDLTQTKALWESLIILSVKEPLKPKSLSTSGLVEEKCFLSLFCLLCLPLAVQT